MSVLRLDESSPYVQAYYKKKAEEERANSFLQKKPTAKQRLQAKGRLKAGTLNRTEQSYRSYLETEKQCGRIEAYWFESLKLKIADGTCWYTPDFMVLRPNGDLELHEVKGSPAIFADDAKVKCKSAATQYPFKLIVVYPRSKKSGGGWDIQEF